MPKEQAVLTTNQKTYDFDVSIISKVYETTNYF